MIRTHCLCRLFAHPKCSSSSESSKTRIKHFAEFRTFARNARPKQSHTCVTSRYLIIVSGKMPILRFFQSMTFFLKQFSSAVFDGRTAASLYTRLGRIHPRPRTRSYWDLRAPYVVHETICWQTCRQIGRSSGRQTSFNRLRANWFVDCCLSTRGALLSYSGMFWELRKA